MELREKIKYVVEDAQAHFTSSWIITNQILQAVQDYYARMTPEEVKLTDEEIYCPNNKTKGGFLDIPLVCEAQLTKASAYYEAKIEQVRKEEREKLAQWLNTNIMSTDNRVTKLWVLVDLVRNLKEGELPD